MIESPRQQYRKNYQSVNQSIFISGIWPINKVGKTDKKIFTTDIRI